MDINEIDLALIDIEHMVTVAVDAAEEMGGSDHDPDITVMPYKKANLLDFAVFDIQKRLAALRAALVRT